mmetsp:Transcript_26866/g.27089  ORF Transcript_26866/g.27089 Transcript_26866/m.27089 type:complete len:86 (+) Transcript_26866:379-636(+)
MGVEIGFLKEICKSKLDNECDIPQNKRLRMEEVILRADNISCHNSDKIDFELEINNLKALYNRCGEGCKKFHLPSKPSSSSSLDW